MKNWPDALIREIAERRVLLFIGAGISKSACPGMPNWPSLVTELSEKLPTKSEKDLVSKLIKKGNLLDAAQIISDTVPAADLTQKMKDTFQVRPTPHHEIYKDLLSLDLKTVITTNYDEFIEKNFEHYSAGNAAYVVCRQNSNDLLDNLRSPTRTIIKIHGCINSATDLVLDRHSYFKAKQGNPGFFNILSALFTVNTVLFLGYSIGDPDMQLILEGINSVTKSTNGHYALLPKFEHKSLDQVIKKSYNIDIIEYQSGNHADVPIKINQLATRVIELRRERGIV